MVDEGELKAMLNMIAPGMNLTVGNLFGIIINREETDKFELNNHTKYGQKQAVSMVDEYIIIIDSDCCIVTEHKVKDCILLGDKVVLILKEYHEENIFKGFDENLDAVLIVELDNRETVYTNKEKVVRDNKDSLNNIVYDSNIRVEKVSSDVYSIVYNGDMYVTYKINDKFKLHRGEKRQLKI
jgi:hypothetical protein